MDQIYNTLNEELDIPDDVFINQENIAVPQPKTREKVMQFEQELSEKAVIAKDEAYMARSRADRIDTTKYKVQKALAQKNNENSLIALIRGISNDISNINRNITDINGRVNNIDRRVNNIDRRVNTMQSDITLIKGDISGMKPLMLYVRTSENARRRELREPQIPVPFLVGDGPEGTDLPSIKSVEDIESLNVEQLRRFLTGYDVQFATRTSRVNLKIMLRDTLGFSKVNDMKMSFS